MRRLLVLGLLGCRPTTICQEDAATRVESRTHVQDAEVRFSPNGGCADEIVTKLANAKKTIRVQAYSFTSAPITEALIAAHQRHIDVQIILDKSDLTLPSSTLPALQTAGLQVFIDSKHAIAHNKVIVIDSRFLETGSFNFTKSAEFSNAENCLFLDDVTLAQKYEANWNVHLAHSTHP